MNWCDNIRTSGKTYRDKVRDVKIYHISPERLTRLKPFSRFNGQMGIFVSESYRSIIEDWSDYVRYKKDKYHALEIGLREVNRDIDTAESRGDIDKQKILEEKRRKIFDSMGSEEYQESKRGYSTLYLHKISCPIHIYKECKALFWNAYEQGYLSGELGFWGWGEQIFIPQPYMSYLEIVSVEKIDIGDLKERIKGIQNQRRQIKYQDPRIFGDKKKDG